MSDDISMVPEALVVEAGKWRDVADAYDRAREKIDGLSLESPAFFASNYVVMDSLWDSYCSMKDLMTTLTSDAATQFREIADALELISTKMDDVDVDSAESLKEIYG